MAPAIDLPTLGQLSQLDPTGAHGIVQRVLATYERSLGRSIAEFETAEAERDTAAIGRLAHTLRSSSASVGALVLSGHCKAVENLVRDGQLERLPAALQALQNESVRVRAAVAAMLVDRGNPT
jgi:HPt (histidine-containing phosphotransfer) domain-containing protein